MRRQYGGLLEKRAVLLTGFSAPQTRGCRSALFTRRVLLIKAAHGTPATTILSTSKAPEVTAPSFSAATRQRPGSARCACLSPNQLRETRLREASATNPAVNVDRHRRMGSPQGPLPLDEFSRRFRVRNSKSEGSPRPFVPRYEARQPSVSVAQLLPRALRTLCRDDYRASLSAPARPRHGTEYRLSSCVSRTLEKARGPSPSPEAGSLFISDVRPQRSQRVPRTSRGRCTPSNRACTSQHCVANRNLHAGLHTGA